MSQKMHRKQKTQIICKLPSHLCMEFIDNKKKSHQINLIRRRNKKKSLKIAGGRNHPSRNVEGKKKNHLPRGFGSSTFCAINPKRIAGTCPGDSGK